MMAAGGGMGEKVDDRNVELFLGKLLRWGVLLAALVVFLAACGLWLNRTMCRRTTARFAENRWSCERSHRLWIRRLR